MKNELVGSPLYTVSGWETVLQELLLTQSRSVFVSHHLCERNHSGKCILLIKQWRDTSILQSQGEIYRTLVLRICVWKKRGIWCPHDSAEKSWSIYVLLIPVTVWYWITQQGLKEKQKKIRPLSFSSLLNSTYRTLIYLISSLHNESNESRRISERREMQVWIYSPRERTVLISFCQW